MYSQSVHWKLVNGGSKDAPSCISCHSAHSIKNRVQQNTTISSVAVPDLCGKCHAKIEEEYKKSIHWLAVKKGVREAPSCNDCHSEHAIHAVNTNHKRAAIEKLQEETCLQCHQNLLLSQRYGMAANNAKSYQDSYHGLAVARGDTNAAMCIDCHGVHSILPANHKNSTINPKNVTATCKKCHHDATEIFARSYSHITDKKTPAGHVENVVRNIYFWLIIIVVFGMIVHNLIILFYELKERYKKSKEEIRIPRLTRNELVQHTILFVSFIILAITGFQLKFPDSWWSHGLQYFGLTENVRREIHRCSATIMITLSLYHVIYLIVTSRGREVLKGMLPKLADFKLAWTNMLFYLRLKKQEPEFDNFTYIEKVEYWALIWGTVIMGLTGFVLWFPTIVGNWAPVWFIKVCEIVHFYEAILATLAIIIWHWFFVMFHPKEYPVSFTVINGQMTLRHYKAEHRLQIERVYKEWADMKAGKLSVKKLSNFTKLFIAAIEKAGYNADEFFQKEMTNEENHAGDNK